MEKFACLRCGHTWTLPYGSVPPVACPHCRSARVDPQGEVNMEKKIVVRLGKYPDASYSIGLERSGHTFMEGNSRGDINVILFELQPDDICQLGLDILTAWAKIGTEVNKHEAE